MLFSGVRLEACEVVEEAQCLGVEFSGGRGDDRHEPVVLSLKPLVVPVFSPGPRPLSRTGFPEYLLSQR